MPIIQPPPAPSKKITIGVRFEEEKLAALRRYGAFIGTRNLSHIISESLDRVYKPDTQYKAWLKTHPDIAIEKKPRRNGTMHYPSKVVSGATAPSLVVAADAASITE
ncbi:MAG TPA: hypothetical protein VGX94_00885 [Terriglobia bacterium]|nr:hypothetical protein [Terriglobia bacterium]